MVHERYQLTSWLGCNDQASVQLYELDGWDHFWPNPNEVPDDMVDTGLDASRLIWEFFDNLD